MAFTADAGYIGVLRAATNYSSGTDQYTLVKITSGTLCLQTAANTDVPIGVLMNKPTSGREALIAIRGIVPVRVESTAHAAISVGNKLEPSSGAGGAVMPSTAGVNMYIIGRAMEALAANTTGVISMLITHQGAGSSGAASAA